MSASSPSSPRGSALLMALILLAVLTVIGTAAVMLASEERNNASAQAKVEFLHACANAAQAKIWAEMAQHGVGYLGSAVQVAAAALPDGTRIIAPAHYDQLSGMPPLVKDVTFKVNTDTTEGSSMNERDCTNGACGLLPLGSTYGTTALCVDNQGRQFEIELALKLAL